MASSRKKRKLQEIETSGHTSVGYTTFPERILSYKWVINNAGIVMNNLDAVRTIGYQGLTSPTFSVTVPSQDLRTTWYLRLHESELESRSWFSIHLCLNVPSTNTATVWSRILMPDCTFSILDSKNEVKHTAEMASKVFSVGYYMDKKNDLSVDDFLAKDNLTEFLYNDSLTIQVTATLVCLTQPTETTHEACATPPDDIRQQMRSLYEEELFTDITIQCGDKQFKAHKVVLASQSSVFKRMFQVDMTETRKNSMEISDIDPLVVSDMLAFLYSGVAPNLETLARDLLMVSNKYELPRLMAMCENALKMEMTVANAVELLLHSDLHQAMKLKKASMEFIHSNATEIYKTDGWKQLKENHSALLCELMEDHKGVDKGVLKGAQAPPEFKRWISRLHS